MPPSGALKELIIKNIRVAIARGVIALNRGGKNNKWGGIRGNNKASK